MIEEVTHKLQQTTQSGRRGEGGGLMFGETGRFDSVRTFTVSRALIQLNPHSNTVEGQTLICLTHFSCLRDTCDAGVRREPDLMILFLFESCFFFFFVFTGLICKIITRISTGSNLNPSIPPL